MWTWKVGDLDVAYPTSSSAKSVCFSLVTAKYETTKWVSEMIIRMAARHAIVVCAWVTEVLKILLCCVEVTNALCGQPTAANSPCAHWRHTNLVCSAKLCVLEIGCHPVHAPEGRRAFLQEMLFALQTSAVLFLMGNHVSGKGSVP